LKLESKSRRRESVKFFDGLADKKGAMKTLYSVLVLASLILVQPLARAEEPIADQTSTSSQKQEAKLLAEMNKYLSDYRTSKLVLTTEQTTLSELAVTKAQLSTELAALKQKLKNFKKKTRHLDRKDRNEDEFDNDYDQKVAAAKAEIKQKEADISKTEGLIAVQETKIENLKVDMISDRQFNRAINDFRSRAKEITDTQQARADLIGKKAAPTNSELTALVNQPNKQIQDIYSKREVLKPIELAPLPIAKMDLKTPEIVMPKTLEFRPIQIDNSAYLKDKQCKDDGLKAMMQGVVAKNPAILSDLYSISVMKMVYAMKSASPGKTSLEEAIKQLSQGKDLKAVKDNLVDLYSEYGKKADFDKIRVLSENSKFGYKTNRLDLRLDNDNASAVVMMLAKENPGVTDLSESDAATIWAVEKIRASQDQKKFALGTLEGNQLNFSTRVYLQAQKSGDLQKNIAVKDEAITKSVSDAFNSLNVDLKKCLSGAACEVGSVLDAQKLKDIQSSLVKQIQRDLASESNAMVDPVHSSVKDGIVTLSIQK
jgi:hypothetical protein